MEMDSEEEMADMMEIIHMEMDWEEEMADMMESKQFDNYVDQLDRMPKGNEMKSFVDMWESKKYANIQINNYLYRPVAMVHANICA